MHAMVPMHLTFDEGSIYIYHAGTDFDHIFNVEEFLGYGEPRQPIIRLLASTCWPPDETRVYRDAAAAERVLTLHSGNTVSLTQQPGPFNAANAVRNHGWLCSDVPTGPMHREIMAFTTRRAPRYRQH